MQGTSQFTLKECPHVHACACTHAFFQREGSGFFSVLSSAYSRQVKGVYGRGKDDTKLCRDRQHQQDWGDGSVSKVLASQV